MTLLAKRYATALLLAANGQQASDQVLTDLGNVHAALADSTLRALLQSPDITAAERQHLLEHLGNGCHQLVQNLLQLLQHRHRLSVLADLQPAYRELVMREHGQQDGVVETPLVLDQAELERLTQLASRLSGRQGSLTMKLRPELLGGVRLFVGNVLFDGSVKTALDQLEQRMLQARVS
jgi:F-type H+-transporting ATPase subunit delta